jgi:hypothetical protein
MGGGKDVATFIATIANYKFVDEIFNSRTVNSYDCDKLDAISNELFDQFIKVICMTRLAMNNYLCCEAHESLTQKLRGAALGISEATRELLASP